MPVQAPEAFHGPLAAVFLQQAGSSAALADVIRRASTSLPVASASERSVWDRASGTADAATITELLARAGADVGEAWPVPLASAAARVHRDGDREGWESVVFARQRRLSRAVVAAAVTLEDRWIDEVADGVQLICEQSSWCWPAHDDTFRRHGSVLATVSDPFLDLGAGEVAGLLAWVDQLLGDQLDERYPGLRSRIRHEVRIRVLEPFVTRRDWHWIGLDGDVHNWNPWIHGNVLFAAIRLLDDPTEAGERAAILSLAIEGIDRYVASLPADGAIDEGYSYWWNGACRALEALDVLSHVTGGVLDPVAAVPALRETVGFPHRCHLGGQWYLNLADGPAKPPADQPWHCLHRAALRAGDTAAADHAAAHRTPGSPVATETDGLGRLLRGLTDESWIAVAATESPLPREVWLASTQVLLARERAGSPAGITLAVKGGHNAEHHNHNDVGSFIVASDGVPVVVDAGRPTYTAATFGPDRYSIWTMQSDWHNVPSIRGAAQGVGREYAASAVSPSVADEAASLELEIGGAYRAEGLRSWRRDARLERGGSDGAVVTIHDHWDLEPWRGDGEPPSSLRMLLAGEVRLQPGAAIVTPLEGAPPVRITWPAAIAANLTPRSLDDPMLARVWGARLTRLELDVSSHQELVVTVQLDISTGEDR